MTATDSPLDITAVDLDGQAFAVRLGNLLTHRRRESGLRVHTLARRSGGQFTAKQLREFEAGRGATLDAAEVAALYGADLTSILPARLPIEIDEQGVVSTAGVAEPFGPDDETSLLVAYLRLVRRLRHQQRAEVIVLRRDDVEVLAAALDVPGETVVDRLGALMGATRVERRVMAGMFIAGAAVIGLTVSTVAATGGPATDAVPPAPDDAAVTGLLTEDLEAGVTTTVEAVDDTVAAVDDSVGTVDDEVTPGPDGVSANSLAGDRWGGPDALDPPSAAPPLVSPPADADTPDAPVVAPPTGTAPATTTPATTSPPTTTEPEVDVGLPPIPTTDPVPPGGGTSPTVPPDTSPPTTEVEVEVEVGLPPIPTTTVPIVDPAG